MLLSERMALRTAITHYQHNVAKVTELSSNPWKCFKNRAEIRRLNVLLSKDAEIICAVLPGVIIDAGESCISAVHSSPVAKESLERPKNSVGSGTVVPEVY